MRAIEILREYETLDEITRPNIDAAEQILRNAGYKGMGTGISGRVFNKPGADHVLKLFHSYDTAYLKFVNLAQNNNNIHFPKFKGKLIKVNAQYYAIQMEKLTPVPDSSGSYLPSSASLLSNKVSATLSAYLDILAGRPSKYGYPSIEVTEIRMDEFEEDQPGIKEACHLISDILDNTMIVDLHQYNMMLRGQTLVITDPVVFD